MPSRPALQLTWVPFPAPGGPSSTARMPLGFSGTGSAVGTLGAMAAEASHCSSRSHTFHVQGFQATAPRMYASPAPRSHWFLATSVSPPFPPLSATDTLTYQPRGGSKEGVGQRKLEWGWGSWRVGGVSGVGGKR